LTIDYTYFSVCLYTELIINTARASHQIQIVGYYQE